MSENKTILLVHPETEQIAEKLLKLSPNGYERIEVSWNVFEDGTPNLMINDVAKLQYRDVMFLTSFRHVEKWMQQIAIIYALPRYLARSVTVVLPYYPTGTMERVDAEGQVATAMTLSRILSVAPLTQHGPVKILIFDIHALQSRFYFRDSVLPCLVSALPLFLRVLKNKHGDENVCIAFPDDGAKKRFGGMFDKEYPLVVCNKVREGKQRVIKISEGDPKNCHVFIVDDLVQSGGTLISCKDILLNQGALKVSSFVTHAVFPAESWRRFVASGWNKVYITDSIPETANLVRNVEPFEVLTIAEEINSFMRNVSC